MSTETVLSRVKEKAEYASKIKEVLVEDFLDIEDAFDNTSLETIIYLSNDRQNKVAGG